MSGVEFLIGADPEFFVKDKNTGKHVSAYGLIPGTKRDPFRVDGGAVQVDGMALEFNINPAKTADEFVSNINTVLEQLREMVPEDYEFDFVPVAQFGTEYIQAQPDAAKELGCDPDYSAYTGEINPKPNADLGFRTASGHVHIGWTEQQDITDPEHIEACKMLTKQLDCYVGLPSLLWDNDTIRSTMYGKPGAFRPKHYGVEYRVLSNAWLASDDLKRLVFNLTKDGAEYLLNSYRSYEVLNSRRDFNNADYGTIFQHWRDYVSISSTDTVHHVKGMYNKHYNKGVKRPAAKLWSERYESCEWFYNSHYDLVHYNDLTPDDLNNGSWSCNSSDMYRRKMEGLPFMSLAEIKAERRAKEQAILDAATKGIKKDKVKTKEIEKLPDTLFWSIQNYNDAVAMMNSIPSPVPYAPPPFPGPQPAVVDQWDGPSDEELYEIDEFILESFDEDDDILEA